jgi:hypothetical protein
MQESETALRALGIRPDFEYATSANDGHLLFLHRKLSDGDLYFITNLQDRSEHVNAKFRVTGRIPELWHARTGSAEPASYTSGTEVTAVEFDIGALDSVFVVFRGSTTDRGKRIAQPTVSALERLAGNWKISFQPGTGVEPGTTTKELGAWNENQDPSIRYFSGTAIYSRTFKIERTWLQEYRRLWLDLGVVRELAEVVVNQKPLQTVWREPYRLQLQDVLRVGENTLEIRVTNLWVNRLIGDAQPSESRVAFTTGPTYRPDAPLRRSGLIGPVVLEGERE